MQKKRVQSIDVLRGIVMVIMALDHVRDYFHITAMTDDPLNLATTTPQLYFTRWVTHFCAPVFVFLSGTSIYLSGLKKTKAALSIFLIKRGFWLILAELIIITLAWTFNPFYNTLILQVIWAIGVSMVVLGLLIRLPYNIILVIGLAIVLGHNLMDYSESTFHGTAGFTWDILHYGRFATHFVDKNHAIIIAYPFVPWTGLMIMGFCFGKIYSPGADAGIRRKLLIRSGCCLVGLFIILRLVNQYGDPDPWTFQRNWLYSFFSFLNVHKYPPSLEYMLITIGPALIALALIEKVQNRITDFFNVFGRVPMFYYILHLYFIHLLCVIFFFTNGHTMDQSTAPHQLFVFRRDDFGYSLPVVYVIWIGLVLLLYPLCRMYDRYKSTHARWWLSYL